MNRTFVKASFTVVEFAVVIMIICALTAFAMPKLRAQDGFNSTNSTIANEVYVDITPMHIETGRMR